MVLTPPLVELLELTVDLPIIPALSNVLTAGTLVGNITGNVTGDVTGTAGF